MSEPYALPRHDRPANRAAAGSGAAEYLKAHTRGDEIELVKYDKEARQYFVLAVNAKRVSM
jgi:hypothetical protein